MTDLVLRPYQEEGIEQLRASYAAGKRAPLYVLPTGGGKSIVFGRVSQLSYARGKRVLLVVHRRELLKQASDKLTWAGVPHGMIAAGFEPDAGEPVQVASIQTLVRREAGEFDLIVFDECFAAGTRVDGRPIESVRKGDVVRSFDERSGEIVSRTVIRTFRKKASRVLRLIFEGGRSVVVTEGHPFFTEKGWVNAEATKGRAIYVGPLHGMPHSDRLPRQGEMGQMETERQDLLFNWMSRQIGVEEQFKAHGVNQPALRFGTYGGAQPDAQRRNPREGQCNAEIYGPHAAGAWGEWETSPGASSEALGCSWRRVDSGITGWGWSEDPRVAHPLHDRYSACSPEGRGRGGWKWPSGSGSGGVRRSEGRLSDVERVDSIEVYEQGRDERFGELCPGGYVYNIEVEEFGTYFANGIAVHNCHHARAKTWKAVIASQPNARLLGVTATPVRLDGKGLGAEHGGFFDDIVCGPSIRELVKQGYLSDARYYVPDERGRANMRGVKKQGGDYVVRDAAKRVNRREITGSAVDQYTKYAKGQPAIAFCTLVEHAESVARDFRLAGYKSWCVHGETPKDERDRLIAGLGNGDVEVLTSCELISEGLDVPTLGAVILLRPTASLGMSMQQVGRGMRPAPGKSHLAVLDHVGNIARHGRPDFERIWTLGGVEHDLITCWHCQALNEPDAQNCSACGARFARKKTGNGPKREAPEVVAGKLVQLSPERISAIKAMSYRQVVTTKLTEQELKLYARLRGYKPGWVWHQMRAQ